MARVLVGNARDFPNEFLCPVDIEGWSVGIVRVDDIFYAFSNYCPHLGAELTGSLVLDTKVICWWHGSAFDLGTGLSVGGPAYDPIKTYPVEVEGDSVYILKD